MRSVRPCGSVLVIERRRRQERARAGFGITLAVLALVAVGATGCGDAPSGAPAAGAKAPQVATSGSGAMVTIAPDSPQLREIHVEAVRTANVPTDEIVAPARVAIDPNRTSRILLPVAGRVTEVKVRLGGTVEQGQPVLAVESPDADAAVSSHLQAQAAERQATAALAKAEADARRAVDLFEVQAIAQKDLLAAQNDLEQARLTLETNRAAREQARRRLEILGLEPTGFRQQILVRSPVNGTVLDVAVAPGEFRSDTSTPLMTIADLRTVWVSSEVPEASVHMVHVGERVSIAFVAFPDRVFSGRVARIADVLDPQTRTVRVHVEMPNPDGRLRPEMYGSTRYSGAARALPVLPPSAVVQQYGRPTVFLERATGSFERRVVVTGPRSGDLVPVLDGLAAGDRVVVDGAVLLKDR